MKDEIVYWAGEPVADMTREQLIDALSQAARLIRKGHEDHRRTLEAWGTFRRLPVSPLFLPTPAPPSLFAKMSKRP